MLINMDSKHGYFKRFDHVPLYSDYNGKAYLMSDCSLRLKDSKEKFNILDDSTRDRTHTAIDEIHSTKFSNNYLLGVGNILSANICKNIIEKVNKKISLQSVNYGQVRQNKRAVIFDQNFAEYLWNGLEDLLVSWFESNNINIMPLGFGVSKGSWEFCGINDAMRFNNYESQLNDKFEIHRDAQYCPSADKRSIMSLVIYLNDDFDGGETKFYLPKDVNINTKGMNIQEEIEAHGGLQHGFKEITVKPKTGNAVLFSQSILHESLPLKSHKKFIIKTDVMVVRKPLLGFTLDNYERKDFFECLNIFRTAQQNELEENNKVANELYQKCLSIRYSYPKALLKSRADDDNDNDEFNLRGSQPTSMESEHSHLDKEVNATNPYTFFPHEIWYRLFEYLVSEDDVDCLVKVFPTLQMFKKPFLEEKCLPKLNYSCGVFSKFSFDCSSLFVKTNLDGFSHLLCGYALFLLGHKAFEDDVKCRHYIVNYDEKEGNLSSIKLKTFLSNLFFKEKSYGTLYKVKQVASKQKNIYYDFEQCVERSYMLMKHEREFCGIDIESEYQCKGDVFDILDENESYYCDSSNESNESQTDSEENSVSQCIDDDSSDDCSIDVNDEYDWYDNDNDRYDCIDVDDEKCLLNGDVNGDKNNFRNDDNNNDVDKSSDNDEDDDIDANYLNNFDVIDYANFVNNDVDNVVNNNKNNANKYDDNENDADESNDVVDDDDDDDYDDDDIDVDDDDDDNFDDNFDGSIYSNYTKNHVDVNHIVDEINDNEEYYVDDVNEINKIELKNKNDATSYKSFESLPFTNENIEILVEKYARLYENVSFTRMRSSYKDYEVVEHRPYEAAAISEITKTKISYIRSANKAVLENVSGGGTVRFINYKGTNLYFMKSNKHCECFMRSDNAILCKLDIYLSKQPINHQIFDFSKQEMKVTRNIPKDDIMYSHLEDRVKKELVLKHNWEKTEVDKIDRLKNAFCVDISSLSQSDISFNHASCQCSFPKAFLKEYVNLESYAHVKNVYIIFKEVEPGKMFAWCCYGGIVAL